jgi:magnesium chelatase family protein
MAEIAKVHSSIIYGLDALPVQVEAEIRDGQQLRFQIVGMGDSAVRESRERIPTALLASGFRLPRQILVNLAPAEIKKEGASLDLAIAIAILVASRQVFPISKFFVHGELSLDASVRPIKGTLAHTITAHENGADAILLPAENLAEARLLPNMQSIGIRTLNDLRAILNGEAMDDDPLTTPATPIITTAKPIFSDIWGQAHAKRALEIAAAGGHNILMQGPPGCGKSMLARRFPCLLPPLNPEEVLETVKIHSIAGRSIIPLLQGIRPLCAPHQGVSQAGLIGGGAANACPGDISLAHHGVLFLDELPEFKKSVLEGLRGPLESGVVEIRRARYGVKFPARFQLVAAMNRCPCGRLGIKDALCSCSEATIASYQSRVSQPIRDRIDLHLSMSGVNPDELFSTNQNTGLGENDQSIQQRVIAARTRQSERASQLNAYLDGKNLTKTVNLTSRAKILMEKATRSLNLSVRSYVRTLRVARTIADLREEQDVHENAVAEALSFREGK